VPLLPKLIEISDPGNAAGKTALRSIANPSHCAASGPILLARARKGRRPQARATVARLRTLRDIPRRFTLKNHRLPLALPQIIRQAQELSRFR